MKELEEQATIYITLSMLFSLFAKDISTYFAIPFLQYLMILIAIILITLGVIKVNQHEKHKEGENCSM